MPPRRTSGRRTAGMRPGPLAPLLVTSLALFASLALLASLAGCGRERGPGGSSATWLAGRAEPAFDPDGPPDALRWALERQLSMGLTERDSSGLVRLGIADSVAVSRDSLAWTFRLRPGLRFTDGTPVRSAHVAEAIAGGLARTDHATRAWLLAAVQGVRQVRAGRPLPRLGIETPDERTLVLRLEKRDRRLPEKLALPGVSAPWKRRQGAWRDAIGVGPFRVAAADGERSLTLVSAGAVAGSAALVDTLRVRFATGAPRVRTLVRNDAADLVWPLPPGVLDLPLPASWSLERRAASPARRLLLVLRADLPPLSRGEARRALAHATNRGELLQALGARAVPLRRWLPGARDDYEWPSLETPAERAARQAREPRHHGREPARPESYHVALAYDADLAGGEVARALQGEWARAGHYADLRPLRGGAAATEALAAAAAQAQLVESQALLAGAEDELALLVTPIRGPSVGGFRTGWRTRDFDRWVASPEPAGGFDPDAVQRVLAEDRIVLPLATLPWLMAVRTGGPRPLVHPAYGPGWTAVNSPGAGPRTR